GGLVDFVPKAATHNERVVSLHSLLDSDFYREGARVTPAPRRRQRRRARRKLSPAPWLVPVTADVKRRLGVITREWQRVDPRFLDEDEQRYWATIAGRNVRYDERVEFAKKFTEGGASRGALETFLATCAAENPNRHEENAAKLVNAAREQPLEVGAALLASAEGYTPRANQLIDAARERLGTLQEVAHGLAENLPAPKQPSGRSRRRRRRRKKKSQ